MAIAPINTGEGSVVGGLKDLAMQYLKQQALTALVAKLTAWAPRLAGALGFLISPIAGFVIGLFLSFLMEQTIMSLAILYISIDVQYDVKNAEDVAR